MESFTDAVIQISSQKEAVAFMLWGALRKKAVKLTD
jgi:uracil DNA glycosylase